MKLSTLRMIGMLIACHGGLVLRVSSTVSYPEELFRPVGRLTHDSKRVRKLSERRGGYEGDVQSNLAQRRSKWLSRSYLRQESIASREPTRRPSIYSNFASEITSQRSAWPPHN